jgi:hypothetical protein
MVVDQTDDPGLEVAPALQLDEERALDVDVPEGVGAASLVAGTAWAGQRRSCGPDVIEKLLDPKVAHPGDLAPAQLGRDALGVPVRVQPHRDHDLLEPAGVTERRMPRATTLWRERAEPAALVRTLPAPQARPAAAAEFHCGREASLTGDAQQPRALADDAQLVAAVPLWWPSATRGKEPKARAFLVRVPQPAAVGVATHVGIAEDLIHARHVSPDVSKTTWNLN